MIIHVAKKEVLEHLKSFRFLVAFVFIIATFFMMMFMRHFDYKSKYDDYLLRINNQEEALNKYASRSNFGAFSNPIVPPMQMEIVVDPSIIGAIAQPSRNLDDNPIGSINIKLDIIAIVGILGSLLALLLSYDSINREVNEGTVKLMLSSGVPRIKIVLGKILGGSLAATLPVAIIFFLTSIWLAIIDGQGFGLNHWTSLLGIFLVSIIYIMFFYCLGALVSSVIADHTLSALSCFGVWILFIVIVPVLSPYMAKSFVKVPGVAEIRRQQNFEGTEANLEWVDQLRALTSQGLSDAEAREKLDAEWKLRWEAMSAKFTAMAEDYKNALAWQIKLSIRLACISPYSIYAVAVEELSGMGYGRFQHIESLISNQWQQVDEYVNHQYDEARKRNPEHADSNKLDLSNMPRFKYIEPTIGYKYSHALPYILLLSAYFLVLPFLFVYALYSRRRLF